MKIRTMICRNYEATQITSILFENSEIKKKKNITSIRSA